MNTPYVKQYNELGEVINRLDGGLKHKFPNRRARHAKPARDFNNKNSFPLVIIGRYRFAKRLQFIPGVFKWDKKYKRFVVDKKPRTIIHYDERKS